MYLVKIRISRYLSVSDPLTQTNCVASHQIFKFKFWNFSNRLSSEPSCPLFCLWSLVSTAWDIVFAWCGVLELISQNFFHLHDDLV